MNADRIIKALSRVTSSGVFIPVIDGLRFVAISAVFMYHLVGYVIAKSPVTFAEARMDTWVGVVLDKGWFGVNLFFLISGFIISLPFAAHHLERQRPVSLRGYYLRRLTRLEPPFIICVTICFVLLMIVKRESFGALLPHFLSTVTYNHNLVYGGRSTINDAAWSLEIEVQFYIMAPLIATLFAIADKRLRRGLLVGLIVLSAATQPLLHGRDLLHVFVFIHFFLTGFLLADVYLADWRRNPQREYKMDVMAVLALASIWPFLNSTDLLYDSPPVVLLACAALFAGCYGIFRGRVLQGILTNRWLVVIGGMCYTIYLYHELIYSFVGRLTIHVHATNHIWVNVLIQWFLMVPFMLVTASVFFVLFEKPFMYKEWPARVAAWFTSPELDRAAGPV